MAEGGCGGWVGDGLGVDELGQGRDRGREGWGLSCRELGDCRMMLEEEIACNE